MIGMCVALIVMGLGFGGPAFRWRGAMALLLVMLSAGALATAEAAADADAHGLIFRMTPASVAIGLLGQAGFVGIFYGLALGIRRGFVSLRARGARTGVADCNPPRL
jgi:hypothetical protein